MKEREKFGSRLGFILVSAGCAVGLGNVWKFPYICGENGGAAFLLIYLVFLIILGLPILICEFAIGRGSRKSIAGAFEELEPEGTGWHRYKYFGIAGNYLLMMFYTMVAGWMLYYAYRMMSGSLHGLDSKGVAEAFDGMLSRPDIMTFWTLVTIVLSFVICSFGLQKGVEKITKVMMTLLIVLMLVLAVRSLTLNGAGEGVAFYLVPDFKRLFENGIGNVVFAAMSHAFFTLSVGIGAMEIFGSYLKRERKLTGEAISIVCLDTFIALMAGLIIIPSCFAYGVEPDSGPSLLFITLPNVFHHMAGGRIWGTCFFVFMSFAALSTVIAVFENIIAMTGELNNWSRKKAVVINLILVTVLSLPAILGYNIWAGAHPLGGNSTWMDLEDFLVSYNILPLGSLLFVLFCTKKNGWGFTNFMEETNAGSGISFPKGIRGYMTYGLPLIISVIYLKGYYDMFASKGTLTLVIWMTIGVALLVMTYCVGIGKKQQAVKRE